MKFILAIVDALVGFVQRNPLLVLVVLILALGAPALLKGIAVFILYFMLGIVLLVIVGLLFFRWRIYKVQRQMEEQFRDAGDRGPFSSAHTRREREGDVKVHKTRETPEKRVSRDVGDYVEFEETKE